MTEEVEGWVLSVWTLAGFHLRTALDMSGPTVLDATDDDDMEAAVALGLAAEFEALGIMPIA